MEIKEKEDSTNSDLSHSSSNVVTDESDDEMTEAEEKIYLKKLERNK